MLRKIINVLQAVESGDYSKEVGNNKLIEIVDLEKLADVSAARKIEISDIQNDTEIPDNLKNYVIGFVQLCASSIAVKDAEILASQVFDIYANQKGYSPLSIVLEHHLISGTNPDLKQLSYLFLLRSSVNGCIEASYIINKYLLKKSNADVSKKFDEEKDEKLFHAQVILSTTSIEFLQYKNAALGDHSTLYLQGIFGVDKNPSQAKFWNDEFKQITRIETFLELTRAAVAAIAEKDFSTAAEKCYLIAKSSDSIVAKLAYYQKAFQFAQALALPSALRIIAKTLKDLEALLANSTQEKFIFSGDEVLRLIARIETLRETYKSAYAEKIEPYKIILREALQKAEEEMQLSQARREKAKPSSTKSMLELMPVVKVVAAPVSSKPAATSKEDEANAALERMLAAMGDDDNDNEADAVAEQTRQVRR